MTKTQPKLPPLQESILTTMHALDQQIAREMQRTPEELEAHGVQKWEPYQKRIEALTTLILEQVGENRFSLDPLLVLVQTFSKAMQLLITEIGAEGLGKVRAEYCTTALSQVLRDCEKGLSTLREGATVM
jgi:hypothetical protein